MYARLLLVVVGILRPFCRVLHPFRGSGGLASP